MKTQQHAHDSQCVRRVVARAEHVYGQGVAAVERLYAESRAGD